MQALEALSAIDIRVQREFFLTQENGWKQVVLELLQAAKNSATSQAAGVLVTSPFSVMLAATAGGCLYVFDSHSHGPHRGALLAVSTVSATNGSMTAYISRFFNKHFALGHNIRLSSGTTVGREYHFVLLREPESSLQFHLTCIYLVILVVVVAYCCPQMRTFELWQTLLILVSCTH